MADFNTTIERVEEFMYMPRCVVVGSYGGGDDMRTARQIFMANRPLDLLSSSLKNKIFQEIPSGVTQLLGLAGNPYGSKAPPLPGTPNDLTWSLSFQVSSQVYGAQTYNLFYQGLLHGDIPKSGRHGATKYPLIGVFDAVGLAPIRDDVATVGINTLKPADQHVHLVDTDSQWHMGSDMAKFNIDQTLPSAKLMCACVDLEALTVNVTCLIILRGDLEDIADKAVRFAKDGSDPIAFGKSLCATLDDVLQPEVLDDVRFFLTDDLQIIDVCTAEAAAHTGPVLYEVNLSIVNASYSGVYKWLSEKHIKEMLQIPGFKSATLSKRFAFDEGGVQDSGRSLLTTVYTVESRAALEAYFANQAAAMRKEGKDKFGNNFEATRRILHVSASFQS